MRKIYSFAVLLAMMLASTTAYAQNFEDNATATFYGSQNYATTPISFSLTAIADAFGLGSKAVTNLDSTLKSRDITLPTKVCLVKAIVFPVVVYGCASWTIKKAECR